MTLPATFDELRANGGVMLHLPRLRWRAEHSLGKLREVGFENIELVEGVDASLEDARRAAERRGWFFDPGLAEGEIGCSISMLGLWTRVVDEDLPYLLVFEDDVLPHPGIGELGPEYWGGTPGDAEFVFMGNHMWEPYIANLPNPQKKVVSLTSSCLHAYVVTNSGARRAFELVARAQANDRWLSTIDIELWRWMDRREIRFACWNGTMLPKAYPTADDFDRDAVLPPDVSRTTCATTGPFMQNYSLGSAIWPAQEPPIPRWAARRHRPRAVLLTAWVPGPTGNGSAIRAGVALEALSSRYDVDLVLVPVWGPVDGDDWTAKLARRTLVLDESVADPFLKRVFEINSEAERHRARIVYPRPMAARFSTPEGAQAVHAFSGDDVELVYVFRLFLAPLAERWCGHGIPTKVVLDIDEDDAHTIRQIAALHRLDGDEGEAAAAEADAEKVLNMADAWVPSADLVLAAADREVASISARYPDVNAQAVLNPSPQTGQEGEAPPVDLLFVGNFSYPPNIDGAQWLCREVRPLVQELLDYKVRISLVGSTVDPAVMALGAQANVDVFADVPSVTPWYRATRVAVAPLRAGGGTRLKILEAFTHRRAVVSTSLGAAGLAVTDGRQLLLADGTEHFARACARLLRDHDLRASLVDAAVDVAIAHARPRIVEGLADTLSALTRAEALRA